MLLIEDAREQPVDQFARASSAMTEGATTLLSLGTQTSTVGWEENSRSQRRVV